MDERFIKKIYRSVALAWAIAMIWSLVLQKPWIALSITIGTAVATASLAASEAVIEKAFVPGAMKPSRMLIKLGLVKYPLICGVLYALSRWDRISLAAFCGGVALVSFAIVAKVMGIEMMERRAACGTGLPSGGSVISSKRAKS